MGGGRSDDADEVKVIVARQWLKVVARAVSAESSCVAGRMVERMVGADVGRVAVRTETGRRGGGRGETVAGVAAAARRGGIGAGGGNIFQLAAV